MKELDEDGNANIDRGEFANIISLVFQKMLENENIIVFPDTGEQS